MLDVQIWGRLLELPKLSYNEMQEILFEEFKQSNPLPTLEDQRYELSRPVSDDYTISYDMEPELQENEKIVSLTENTEPCRVPDFTGLNEISEVVRQVFTYEASITDDIRQSLIEKYDIDTGEDLPVDAEVVFGTVQEDQSTVLSDEEIAQLSMGEDMETGVGVTDNFEGYEENNTGVEEMTDDDLYDDGLYSDEEEDEEYEVEESSEAEDLYLDEEDEDEGYETGVEEATDDDLYDDGLYSDEEYEDEESGYVEYENEEEGYETEVEESSEDEELYLDEEDDAYEDYEDEEQSEVEEPSEDEETTDDDLYDDEDEDYGYEEQTGVDQESAGDEETTDDALYGDEDYGEDVEESSEEGLYSDEEDEDYEDYEEEDEDTGYDDEDESEVVQESPAYEEEYDENQSVSENSLEETKTEVDTQVSAPVVPDISEEEMFKPDTGVVSPVKPRVEHRVSEPERVEQVPTDIRQFLRKYPRSEISFVLKYFTKKQVNDAIKIGKIIKKGNILI